MSSMYKDFNSYIDSAMRTHSGDDLSHYVRYCTNKLFDLTKDPINSEIIKVSQTKLIPRRFYLIKYNYNGNKIWCPILALDYKVIKNKHILYAINLEYLPPKYKKIYFDLIFKTSYDELEKVAKSGFENISGENLLPFDFEFIYKTLKQNGGMNYVITAYDYLKVVDIYQISIKIAPEIIFCDPKRYNLDSMKELYLNLPESEEKDTLEEILELYTELIETYQEDSIAYHKRVANFEKHLKIIK